MPSVKELFRIMEYLNTTPDEFFAPLSDDESQYAKLCKRPRESDLSGIEKVNQFLDMLDS